MRNRGQKRDFGRGRPSIPPRSSVYIVCEGEKTEYYYFIAIKQERRLTNVTVKIDPGSKCGSDPKSLIAHAKRMKVEGERDAAWCVFDGDGRSYIDQALLDAAKRPKVGVAFSNPCFELWYYLHYEYSTGACTQSQMLNRLKKHIPDYTKAKNVFLQLPDKAIAIRRAAELRKHHTDSDSKVTENPSTDADALVELLYSLQYSR